VAFHVNVLLDVTCCLICRRPRLAGVSRALMEFVVSKTLGVTIVPAALDVVAEESVDSFEVGYVGDDGAPAPAAEGGRLGTRVRST
jgi:hypothetical protein